MEIICIIQRVFVITPKCDFRINILTIDGLLYLRNFWARALIPSMATELIKTS